MSSSSSSRVWLTGLGITAASILAVSQVIAHEGATGVVKERMDYMKTLGDNTGAIGAMFKGEAPYDLQAVQEHAGVLAGEAPRLTELFPEGSNEAPSETLPVTWEQWEDFQAKAADFQAASTALQETAGSGVEQAEVRAAFVRMGRTCGGCHEVYRKPKE